MASNSSSASLFDPLIFSGTDGRDAEDIERELEELEKSRRQNVVGASAVKRPSLYVQTFENMVHTVWEHEYHLLSEEEWDVLGFLAKLPYNARYVLVRLTLRKPNQWYCLAGLNKYKSEVGEDGIVPAILELCRPIHEVANNMDVDVKQKDIKVPKQEEREIIDLTLDDSDSEEDISARPITPGARTSHLHPPSHSAADFTTYFGPGPTELNLRFLCEDERSMSLADVLERLSVKQLTDLAKATKTQVLKPNKPSFISALLYYSSTQTSLDFTSTPKGKGRGKGKARDDGLRQTTLAFPALGKGMEKLPQRTQETRLREMALEMLGKCVRMNYDFFRLIRRLHIICYRSTEHPSSILLPALLTSFKKRSYPEYKYGRDCNIWSTREELMNYEEALEIEARIDGVLDTGMGREFRKGRGSKMAAVVNRHQFVTPVTPGMGGNLAVSTQTPGSSSGVRVTDTPGRAKLESEQAKRNDGDEENITEVKESVQLQKARIVKTVFDELVYPRWKDLLVVKDEESEKKRKPGLERFEPGFVYTRMTQKAAHALGMLKEYEYQAEVIDALLGQRLWRRGKRARWHERRAVLLTRYLCFDEEGRKKQHVLREAMRGVVEALRDEDTGIVYRPSLVRRLVQLEKQLKVPEPERCVCEGELKKADEVFVEAVRIWHRAGSMKLDANGRVVGGKGKENKSRATTPRKSEEACEYFTPKATSEREGASESPVTVKRNKIETRLETASSSWRWKGKSLWLGNGGEEVNVETRALQYYEGLGYRGFHSETRILTTIFALLFWDVIFTDVPGAFETPYQSAPLDMAEDAFYYMRKDLIEARLTEIKDGQAREILERHDSKYREKETWCVGVRWDICERTDLVEILECLGGKPLSIICRLFCEDYAGRSSGVPDLIVWNAKKGLCKFVEVKGPGDTAQENQKLWFDSLLGAGTAVEVCKVVEQGHGTKKKGRGKRPKVRKGKESAKTAPSHSESEPESEDEELINDTTWNSQIEIEVDFEPKAKPRPPGSKRPTDDNELPVFTSSPPKSMPSSTPIRRAIINRAEVVITSPSKKRRLA